MKLKLINFLIPRFVQVTKRLPIGKLQHERIDAWFTFYCCFIAYAEFVDSGAAADEDNLNEYLQLYENYSIAKMELGLIDPERVKKL